MDGDKTLPRELWTLVFGLLSHVDRLRVRAVCKHFRSLVDSSGLWRDWTVELRAAKGAYKEHFWRTLRRWRVSSALLSAPRVWTHVAAQLPQLTALVLSGYRQCRVDSLRCFTRLERLFLRQCSLCVPLHVFLSLVPSQLTRMRMCECNVPGPFFDKTALAALSQFSQLQSFVCHGTFTFPPWFVLHSVLLHLPQLQHLSLSVNVRNLVEPLEKFPPLQEHGLRSLELVECSVWSLPADTMKTMARVQSLAVFFSSSSEDASEDGLLRAWLTDLSALSSLLLVNAPPVAAFVRWMSSSVTRLTLRPSRIGSEEMMSLSARLPNLRHFHLEPRSSLGLDTALIPRLFPGLRSLRLCHQDVPEEAFLSLAALEELRLLETQDWTPAPAGLVSKLQELTKNRVKISKKPDPDRVWSCSCVHYIPIEKWA